MKPACGIALRLRALAVRLERLIFFSETDAKIAIALAQELRDEAGRLEKL